MAARKRKRRTAKKTGKRPPKGSAYLILPSGRKILVQGDYFKRFKKG